MSILNTSKFMLVLEEAFSGKEKLALLGFSLSRVWTYGFLMLAAQGIANLELITNLRVSPVHAIFFTCGTIVALTFAFLAPKIEPWFNRHTYHCVAIVGTLAAICLACSLMSGLGILWFIALLLGGSTLALIRMSWGQIYGKLDPRFMGLYTGLSFCCAVGFDAFLMVSSQITMLILLLILPACSAITINLAACGVSIDIPPSDCAKDISSQTVSDRRRSTISLVKLAIGMFAFVFATTFLRHLLGTDGFPDWLGRWYSILVDLFVAVCFLGFYLIKGDLNPLPVYRSVVLLIITGYVLFSLVGDHHRVFASMFATAGYGLFDLLSWIVMARVAQETPQICNLRVFSGAIAATLAGRALGYILGGLCHYQLEAGVITLQSMSLVMILVLVAVGISILPENSSVNSLQRKQFADETPSKPKEDDLTVACRVLSQQAGLTPREADVLNLLAKGYNANAISTKLYIAKGTVQTHIKHVYAKLEIHNQQELIELAQKTNPHNL